VTTVEQILRPDPRRDRYGRYLLPTGPDGKDVPYTRVTTFAASVDDRWNLEQWKQRMVATGLVNRPDLFAQAAANLAEKQKLNRICEEAVEAAKGSAGANLGSALHSFTEQIDLGMQPVIPEPWDADIAAYQRTLQANGVRVIPEFVERIILNNAFGVAGTFDRLVHIDGWPHPVIADLKTGNLDHASAFGAIAIQLALYASADQMYDPATDALEPMPQVDRRHALVIHLPAGQATCTLHMVDITAGWEAAKLCGAVRDWRKRKNLAEPFASTLEQRITWLTARVVLLKEHHPLAFTALGQRWPAECPTFKQGGHTVEHVAQITDLLSTIEGEHQVAFGDPDPANIPPTDAELDVLEERFNALNPESQDALKQVTAANGVPNVRSRKFTREHFDLVIDLIAGAEEVAATNSTTTVQDNRSTAA
jgi:hypothetical protein